MLAGVHVGCFELFANEAIHGIRDLKGKRVGVQGLGAQGHTFLTSMAAYVGLDPVKDIDWVVSRSLLQRSFLPRERSMHSSASRPSRRSFAPARSVAW